MMQTIQNFLNIYGLPIEVLGVFTLYGRLVEKMGNKLWFIWLVKYLD